MAGSLDEAVVLQIIEGNTSITPTVQVYNVSVKNAGKVTMVVSDGKQFTGGVLSTDLCAKYKENNALIKDFCIIKVTDFGTMEYKGTKNGICVIKAFDIIEESNSRVGNPVNIMIKNANSSKAPQAPNQTFNEANNNKNNNSNSNNNNSNNNNNNENVNDSNENQPKSKINTHYQPISSLNPYQARWRVKVRVTQKSNMRTYMRDNKECHVFSINLLDSEGTEIQATMFNEVCKKFYGKIEEGSIYYIGNGRVTIARQKYTHIKNDYAITLNENSEVTFVPSSQSSQNSGNNGSNNNSMECDDNDDIIMAQVYRFVPIEQLNKCEHGSYVDICATVVEVKDITKFISKNSGRELFRRNILLTDATCKTIDLTTWGDMAQEFDKNKLANNPIIVMKACRVSEYAGIKQLACNNTMLINPFDTVKEATTLHNWYENEGGKQAKLEPLAMAPGAAGGTASKIPRYSISEVRSNNIGLNNISNTPMIGGANNTNNQNNGNKAEYFTTIGTITRGYEFNRDTNRDNPRLPWYKACPDANANNAKVTPEADGRYYCMKNNKHYNGYIARYVTRFAVCDYTGSIWLSAFNDAATMILGTDCATVEKMYQNGDIQSCDKVFKSSYFKRFVFRVRAKAQEYNGEQRVRYDLVSVQPINFKQESANLLKKIELLKSVQST